MAAIDSTDAGKAQVLAEAEHRLHPGIRIRRKIHTRQQFPAV